MIRRREHATPEHRIRRFPCHRTWTPAAFVGGRTCDPLSPRPRTSDTTADLVDGPKTPEPRPFGMRPGRATGAVRAAAPRFRFDPIRNPARSPTGATRATRSCPSAICKERNEHGLPIEHDSYSPERRRLLAHGPRPLSPSVCGVSELRKGRLPRHRPGRRRLHFRHGWQAVPRRHRGHVVRQHRLRPSRRWPRRSPTRHSASPSTTPSSIRRTRPPLSWRPSSAELAPSNLNHVFYSVRRLGGQRHRRPHDPLLLQPAGPDDTRRSSSRGSTPTTAAPTWR